MDDFSALAARVAASVGELRGCLILSRDGLVLGAFPDGEEQRAKPAWLRFAALGEPRKGFVEYGDETWVYMLRGPYAAFAVCGTNVRPGLVIDMLEQALLTAESTRSKRDALKLPEVPAAPSGKPRTSLHPEPKEQEVQAPGRKDQPKVPVASRAPDRSSSDSLGAREASTEVAGSAPAVAPAAPASSAEPSGGAEGPTEAPEEQSEEQSEEEDDSEVDRVMLAQEFSRLLQDSQVPRKVQERSPRTEDKPT